MVCEFAQCYLIHSLMVRFTRGLDSYPIPPASSVVVFYRVGFSSLSQSRHYAPRVENCILSLLPRAVR